MTEPEFANGQFVVRDSKTGKPIYWEPMEQFLKRSNPGRTTSTTRLTYGAGGGGGAGGWYTHITRILPPLPPLHTKMQAIRPGHQEVVAPGVDDPSVSTEAIKRQLHIWELEDAMEWEHSSCLFFNDLENEPPTADQLRLILRCRQRDASVALQQRKQKDRRFIGAMAIGLSFMIAAVASFVLAMVFT
jgi:hypothetical protein